MPKKKQLPEYILALMRTYQMTQDNLILAISNNNNKSSIRYQKDLLRQVDSEIEKLNKFAYEWSNKNIRKAYNEGVNSVISHLNNIGYETNINNSQFAQLHNRAISILTQNTIEDLVNANNFVGRTMRDNVRAVTLQEIQQQVAMGLDNRQTSQRIANRLIDNGYNDIVTSSGRNMNVERYAEMVARTTTREATNRATLNEITYSGLDLVKISSHNSPCDICAPLEGRIYSISGKSTVYPPLTKAYTGIYANIHPNCRHVLMPYVPELADNVNADIEFSNRPFNIDPRSQKSIDNYNNEQKAKQLLNRDRKQWERYKTLMPNDTPKTLSSFRTIKRANKERYKELQSNYRSIRIQHAST